MLMPLFTDLPIIDIVNFLLWDEQLSSYTQPFLLLSSPVFPYTVRFFCSCVDYLCKLRKYTCIFCSVNYRLAKLTVHIMTKCIGPIQCKWYFLAETCFLWSFYNGLSFFLALYLHCIPIFFHLFKHNIKSINLFLSYTLFSFSFLSSCWFFFLPSAQLSFHTASFHCSFDCCYFLHSIHFFVWFR